MRMDDLIIEKAAALSYFFIGQGIHLLILLFSGAFVWYLAEPALNQSSWLGISEVTWLFIGLAVVFLHQLIVSIVFRLQLGWALFTRLLGKMDLVIWAFLFSLLLIARPLTVMGLSRASQGTLNIGAVFSRVVALLLLIPAAYTLWSVLRYFGLIRAMGGDHFRTKYREMPLVTEGAFKYTDNAMYKFAFLLLWAISLYYRSYPGMLLAVFQHINIWAFYYCTEKPDMELIYQ